MSDPTNLTIEILMQALDRVLITVWYAIDNEFVYDCILKVPASEKFDIPELWIMSDATLAKLRSTVKGYKFRHISER